MIKEKEVVEMIKSPEKNRYVSIVKTQLIREHGQIYATKPIQTPEDAAMVAKQLLKNSDKEMLIILSLDGKGNPVYIEVAAIGTSSCCLVDIPNVYKHAIIANAISIICFHNHLSDKVIPSNDDIETTKRMIEAGKLLGIRFDDHIILGLYEDYVSIRETQLIEW